MSLQCCFLAKLLLETFKVINYLYHIPPLPSPSVLSPAKVAHGVAEPLHTRPKSEGLQFRVAVPTLNLTFKMERSTSFFPQFPALGVPAVALEPRCGALVIKGMQSHVNFLWYRTCPGHQRGQESPIFQGIREYSGIKSRPLLHPKAWCSLTLRKRNRNGFEAGDTLAISSPT